MFLRFISAFPLLAPHAFSLAFLTIAFGDSVVYLFISHGLVEDVFLIFSSWGEDRLFGSIFIDVRVFGFDFAIVF